MIVKILRFISKLAGRNWKNSRGQGIIETQFVTILFFTVTFFGIMDMTRIIILELKAFNTVYMAARIACIGDKNNPELAKLRAQSAAYQMFGIMRLPYTFVEWEPPNWNASKNGMGKCTVRFYYKQNIMFPGLLQPAYDMFVTRRSDTLDPFVIFGGFPGISIMEYIGPNVFFNGYYYAWDSGGSYMKHKQVPIFPAGYEWMKMMGKEGGAGPITY